MKRALVFFLALVVVAGVIVGVALSKTHTDTLVLPSREVDTFLHAWARDDPADMATLLDAAPPDLADQVSGLVKAVPGSTATYTRTGISGTKTDATATYHAQVSLKGLGPIEWNGTMALVHPDAGWRIKWGPNLLFPGLGAGRHVAVNTVWPKRASILAANGSVLAGDQSAVEIGLRPDHIKSPADLEQVKFGMQAQLGVLPADIDKALHQPWVKPDLFVPIKTVPKDAKYQEIRAVLYPIPGIVFQGTSGVAAVDSVLASEIIGSVGEITADRLKELGAPYKVGDQVGLSGMQNVYERRLAGTPRTDVVIADPKGVTVKAIKHFPGQAPQPVQLTIDPAIQTAAEAALAGVTKNAALVAIDTTTGGIRAVVSKPYGGFNRALAGTYPPGSTFKVITSAALLGAGSTASTPAPCPKSITVDGRSFQNFEGEASGALDLARAFQISCNNAFIGLGDKLPADTLTKAATSFGFNAHWSLGIESSGGSYPTPSDRAELAASAIGQGRVLTSPVQMASVAAAVASGQWRAPSLVSSPAPKPGPTVPPLNPGVDATLKSFMASVIRGDGTAAGAGLPADSYGKTGTAEFANGSPPPTHAWYIGFRGNLAFAIIVEDGGVGGRVAAPLAAGFLNAVAP
jgi:cell division protein FtsI/penicillin-binding protein 2